MGQKTARSGLLAAVLLLIPPVSAAAERLYVCSGYGCFYKKSLVIGPAERQRLATIMGAAKGSAAAERAAVAKAVRYFETLATQVIGVRDSARSALGGAGVYGQMDCIDESRNTHALLAYLQQQGLLRHHTVRGNTGRGLFVDVRYPHATAVLRAGDGEDWAVDSWYEPAGGAPDIMKLSEWRKRGVGGER